MLKIVRVASNEGVDTELRQVFTAAVRKALADLPEAYDPKKYLAEGRKAVQARVQELIRLLGSDGKA